jgi:hypothetical protein
VPLFSALRHLIVTGNALLYQDKSEDQKLRVFRLDQYVCRRNPAGRVMEIVVREFIYAEEVPLEMVHLVPAASNMSTTDKPIELYTHAKRVDGKWLVYQELAGHVIEGTIGAYEEHNFPFLALTWTLHPGENYGRGHAEENLGDFLSLEGLRQAFLEGAAALAKLVFLVSPNGTTKVKDLQNAPNGGFAQGRKDDISTLQADKMADFQFVQSEIIRLEANLSKAFLLTESIQRNAERVTRLPSKSTTWLVRVTSSSRFTPCTPSFTPSITDTKIDASNCPVDSCQIGENGKISSRGVIRNSDRQL